MPRPSLADCALHTSTQLGSLEGFPEAHEPSGLSEEKDPALNAHGESGTWIYVEFTCVAEMCMMPCTFWLKLMRELEFEFGT